MSNAVASPPSFRIGDAVTLRVAPRPEYRCLLSKPAEIRNLYEERAGGRNLPFATILVDDGSETGVLIRDVPVGFLSPPKDKPKRRGPLYLKSPGDERDEATRMSDGLAFIALLGYRSLRVGQGRAAAICHACSRRSRENGGPGMVRIHCKDCGGEGFAPSTNSTPGTPDSFVWHDRWRGSTMLPVEWKDAENGRRSEEQATLEDEGRIVVAWDTPSLCWHIAAFEEEVLHLEPLPVVWQEAQAHEARRAKKEAVPHA